MKVNNYSEQIQEYIRKNFSWKEMYFNHFSIKQKVLFFVPILFIFSPILGVYFLYKFGVWPIFIISGIIMLLAIYVFFKQREKYAEIIFLKKYATKYLKTDLDYKLHQIENLLGSENTEEKRFELITFFRNKVMEFSTTSFISLIAVMSAIMLPSIFKFNSVSYYLGVFTCILLFMSISFILPALFNHQNSRVINSQALQLLKELEKREYGKE